MPSDKFGFKNGYLRSDDENVVCKGDVMKELTREQKLSPEEIFLGATNAIELGELRGGCGMLYEFSVSRKGGEFRVMATLHAGGKGRKGYYEIIATKGDPRIGGSLTKSQEVFFREEEIAWLEERIDRAIPNNSPEFVLKAQQARDKFFQ